MWCLVFWRGGVCSIGFFFVLVFFFAFSFFAVVACICLKYYHIFLWDILSEKTLKNENRMSFSPLVKLGVKEQAFAYVASASIARAGLLSFGNNYTCKSLRTHDRERYGHYSILIISRTFRVSILSKKWPRNISSSFRGLDPCEKDLWFFSLPSWKCYHYPRNGCLSTAGKHLHTFMWVYNSFIWIHKVNWCSKRPARNPKFWYLTYTAHLVSLSGEQICKKTFTGALQELCSCLVFIARLHVTLLCVLGVCWLSFFSAYRQLLWYNISESLLEVKCQDF